MMTDTVSEEPKRKASSPPIEELVGKLPTPPLPDQVDDIPGIRFVDYPDESQLDSVMNLVGRDLSEPYSSTFTIVEESL